jgi:hypothetical protein
MAKRMDGGEQEGIVGRVVRHLRSGGCLLNLHGVGRPIYRPQLLKIPRWLILVSSRMTEESDNELQTMPTDFLHGNAEFKRSPENRASPPQMV